VLDWAPGMATKVAFTTHWKKVLDRALGAGNAQSWVKDARINPN
jgi:hypothetical protein